MFLLNFHTPFELGGGAPASSAASFALRTASHAWMDANANAISTKYAQKVVSRLGRILAKINSACFLAYFGESKIENRPVRSIARTVCM